jgi:hypothetical protein
MPKRKDRPKGSDVRPGPNVGQPSPADDGVPLQEQRRGQTIRTAFRGRKQPAGRAPTRTPRPPR